MTTNGMGQAKENSPYFEVAGKRLVRKTVSKQTDPELDDEQDWSCEALYAKYGH